MRINPVNKAFGSKFEGRLGEDKVSETLSISHTAANPATGWQDLVDVCCSISRGCATFQGNQRRLRVTFPRERVTVIYRNVKLQQLGFQPDKKFKPHVTIFRVKKKIENVSNELQKFSTYSFGRQVISEVKLKKSELTPNGPIYTDLMVVKGKK